MINTADLKQTLVARACSYELAHEICDEIDRLRAERDDYLRIIGDAIFREEKELREKESRNDPPWQ